MRTRSQLLSTLLLGGMAASAGLAYAAEPNPWLVRVRAAYFAPADKSDAASAYNIGADKITVGKKTIPDLDISYFFTPNIALELLLTYPQSHTVQVNGKDVGSFKQLPPTLTVQYHFMPNPQFKPYVGAGLNYTNISSVDLKKSGLTNPDLSKSSIGLALQAGVDFRVDKNIYINADLKKLWLSVDLKSGSKTVSKLGLDPMIYSLGVGYRF